MRRSVALFEVNPNLDRPALARRFACEGRVQIRNVLTEQTAREVRKVLSLHTNWGVAWQAGNDGPHSLVPGRGTAPSQAEKAQISSKLLAAMRGDDYAFIYGHHPFLTAYQEKWDEGSPQDLLLEYINAEPFMSLVREVTALPELKKADAQGTLYRPGDFLAVHSDSHLAEGWRVAYVLSLATDDWRPEWGGYLQFYDEDGDVIAGYKPRFNALNLFSVPRRHGVSYVPPFAPLGRYSITGWFRDS